MQGRLDQFGGVNVELLVNHPSPDPADAATAHDKQLHCRRELVFGDADQISVEVFVEHHSIAIERRLHRLQLIAQSRSALKILRV